MTSKTYQEALQELRSLESRKIALLDDGTYADTSHLDFEIQAKKQEVEKEYWEEIVEARAQEALEAANDNRYGSFESIKQYKFLNLLVNESLKNHGIRIENEIFDEVSKDKLLPKDKKAEDFTNEVNKSNKKHLADAINEIQSQLNKLEEYIKQEVLSDSKFKGKSKNKIGKEVKRRVSEFLGKSFDEALDCQFGDLKELKNKIIHDESLTVQQRYEKLLELGLSKDSRFQEDFKQALKNRIAEQSEREIKNDPVLSVSLEKMFADIMAEKNFKFSANEGENNKVIKVYSSYALGWKLNDATRENDFAAAFDQSTGMILLSAGSKELDMEKIRQLFSDDIDKLSKDYELREKWKAVALKKKTLASSEIDAPEQNVSEVAVADIGNLPSPVTPKHTDQNLQVYDR